LNDKTEATELSFTCFCLNFLLKGTNKARKQLHFKGSTYEWNMWTLCISQNFSRR